MDVLTFMETNTTLARINDYEGRRPKMRQPIQIDEFNLEGEPIKSSGKQSQYEERRQMMNDWDWLSRHKHVKI